MTIKQRFNTTLTLTFVLSLAVLCLVFLYWPAFVDITQRWESQEEYSHGYIIPFLCLYFVWQKKNALSNIEFEPTWLGYCLVFFGLLFLIVGKVSILFILMDYSFIMVVTGLVWSVIGTKALKVIIVPLLILIFAIPLPSYLDALLSSKLQLLSSRLGVEFIVWCRIPVFLEGNIIDLGDYKLQVVEACNGLRYMFPLLSIGFICAYLFNTDMWKRVLVFFSSIPITIIMNSFRIGVAGFLVNRWGIETAEGFLHDFEGWVVFMASLALLIIEMLVLSKLSSDTRSLTEMFGIVDEMPVTNVGDKGERDYQKPPLAYKHYPGIPFYLSLLSLILVYGLLVAISNRDKIIPERQRFVDFPMQIKAWQGRKLAIDEQTLTSLNLTDYILADFRNIDGDEVNFYVAYYEAQKRNVMPHSPRLCIPGGGWEIASISRESVDGFPVNRMLIKKGLEKSLVYYWYQQRGQIVANEYEMKWSLFKDALLSNRTDGALVRLSTKIYSEEDIEQTENRLKGFFDVSLPMLRDYIPE